jgi:Uma2 family endonuclease
MPTASVAVVRWTSVAHRIAGAVRPSAIKYVRPIHPIEFPASDPEWDMGEGELHGRLCELIYQVLRAAVGKDATVGKDHFIYWDGADSKRKCAPDAFVKLNLPKRGKIESWKTWERGTPELCIEILSRSDTQEKLTLREKLVRFHALGTCEVVAFDADARQGRRLRAWDRVDGDLVERVVVGERTPCRTLGGWFVVTPYEPEEISAALRLAHDPQGKQLVLTQAESNLEEIARLRAALESRAKATPKAPKRRARRKES